MEGSSGIAKQDIIENLKEVEKQRKINEKNILLLQNRVNLLEMEDKRAKRILEHTKKRTVEIITSKNMYQERHRLNEEVKRREQERV